MSNSLISTEGITAQYQFLLESRRLLDARWLLGRKEDAVPAATPKLECVTSSDYMLGYEGANKSILYPAYLPIYTQ